MADLPPHPPDAAPVAAIVAPAQKEAQPIGVDSHGFHYTINGNVFLPASVVIATLQAAETPKDALETLRKAYVAAGYVLVALRGEVQGQLVAIQVINGRITESDFPPSLAPYFNGLLGRPDLDRNTLILKSSLAETYAARQGLRPQVNFSPAAEVGGTKMTVTEEPIEGAKAWNVGLGFGNLGSRFASRYIAQASAVGRPGNGWEFTGNYSYGLPGLASESAGSLYHAGGFGLSKVTPWGLYGATLTSTKYRIGDVAAPLNPTGEIKVWGVNGTQLVFADETTRWVLTEAFTRTSNVVEAFDGLFILTDQHYNYVSLGTNYNKAFALLGQNANAGVGLTLSQGMSGRTGTIDPGADGVPNPRFLLIQANGTYTQALPLGFSAGLSLTGQWADSTLPQNQQWVLGGLGNLSAWVPAVLTGDMGLLGRTSVSAPAWTWKDLTVTGAVFVEAGVASSHFTPAGTPNTRGLSDGGVTLSGALKSGTSISLTYARPWGFHNLTEAGRNALAHANLYFSLNQTF